MDSDLEDAAGRAGFDLPRTQGTGACSWAPSGRATTSSKSASTSTTAFLDVLPAAYKDIDVVMDDAKDLVDVRHDYGRSSA